MELEKVRAELAQVKAELEALKSINNKQAPAELYAETSAYGKLKQIGEQLFAVQNTTNLWRNSPLEAINELKPDPAGKVGEEFMKTLCAVCGIHNESTGDKNSKDGTYDQKIGEAARKVEIKTARLGGGKYQHETLKKDGYDYICFIDIHPTGGCITILPRFEMTGPHPITGTTPTPRKGTTDVFKWDFTELHLKRLIAAGAAVSFDTQTSYTQLGDFIRSKIV